MNAIDTIFINPRFNLSTDGLRKLNSITKYPSILTYHNLGPKGSLVDSLVEDKSFDDRVVYITEKIDGTNSRIIFFTDSDGHVCDYLIGSREELLHAMGDRIINPTQGIVNNMIPVAESIRGATVLGSRKLNPDSIYCLYGETYGSNINGAKQYTGHAEIGLRIFDMWHMSYDDMKTLLSLSPDKISSWREHGGQPFVSVSDLKNFCNNFDVEIVPYIETISGSDIPTTLQEVWDWMQKFAVSTARLDDDGKGQSEGVVVRYEDRSLIRKIRFEDYQRTKRLGLIK